MAQTEETKATDLVHIGCGGMVLVSLDAATCAECGSELREADWRRAMALDELRAYAERVSQESGMATVIVAIGTDQREYAVTPEKLGQYSDPVSGALVEALRQRQEVLRAEGDGDASTH